MPVQAAPPRRVSPTLIAIGAVAVVVVIVVALVLVKVTGSSNSGTSSQAPVLTPASPSTLAKLTGVSLSEAQAVGLPKAGVNGFQQPPQVLKNEPLLTYGGRPGALFIGGEFCPYCAATRWSVILALSRFGTFSGLKETTSSPWDVDPATATFSFFGSSYQSSYLVFRGVENESNDTGPNGQGRHVLMHLTSQESNLWANYSARFGVQQGFPFFNIGNKVFETAPPFNPQVLAGLDQNQIASRLSNTQDPVTQNIVGDANYLTAGICAITGGQPTSVCSAPIVTQASHALGLS